MSQEVFQLIIWQLVGSFKPFMGILSDQGTEFVNQDFEKHARQRGIHLATSPAHQPQSNGVAERLVVSQSDVHAVCFWLQDFQIFIGGVPCDFAAEMLRHKALGFQWHVPAFGEEVGTSQRRSRTVDCD